MDWSAGSKGKLPRKNHEKALRRLHVVTLRLICIGERKRADGLIKSVVLAQIATDSRGIPGLGMGAGQGPAAELGIVFDLRGGDFLDGSRHLHVPQLAHKEVMPSLSPQPSQEDVAG